MSLAPGTQLGPYEITGALGAGGMGEVYRARDTSLKRHVALKVLPKDVADDQDRLARFEREAHILAQLNHPHIAQIYGIEQAVPTASGDQPDPAAAPSSPVRALVMELVEGPTLEERLRAGAIPVDEALLIARQVADALEAAHEQGVVHRDLKPANIKVRGDGDVKVLDFGIAKSHEANPEALATLTTPAMTEAGTILGTAAYMSPEQARGRPVDKRADIWAYGCVLFEMLAGRRPFDGGTVTDTLAAVVTREPEWTALPAETPQHVRALIARCLVKDAKQRLRDIGDARLELTGSPLGIVAIPKEVARPPKKARTPWLAWMLAAAATAVAGVALLRPAWLGIAPPPQDAQAAVTRFLVLPPAGTLETVGTVRSAGHFEISPDGRRVAMLASAPGGRLWVRDLSALEPVQVRGTERASRPFWSPDGRAVGYFAGGYLFTVDLSTSTQFRLTPSDATGATWNSDGVILFTNQNTIHRIAASGGAAQPVTALDEARGDRRHMWPVFLPDNRQFIFLADTSNERTTGIYLGALDTTETRFLTAAASNAAYALGYLVFARGDTLVALVFDAETGVVSGEPHNVARRVAYNPTTRHAEFSVSRTGVLTHSAAAFADVRLGWFDRTGAKVGNIEALAHMDISPDDTRVAADRFDPETGMRDIWVFDEKRGTRTRLTFSPANDWVPVWSADGRRILYTSDHETPGTHQIYQRAADGSGREELVLKTGAHKHHMDVSRDGRLLAFQEDGKNGPDLWLLSLTEGGAAPTPIVNEPYDESQPGFSPDSKLLAYTSNASGAYEVYVQSLAAGGGKWQISTNGGVQPRWRRDGREMYYLAADGKVMVLDVDLTGPTFGTPRALFQGRVFGDSTTEHFTVTSDGQRFLMQVPSEASSDFVVVQNWWRELTR